MTDQTTLRTLLTALLVLGCTSGGGTALRIDEGTGYATDQVTGVLHVTAAEAYFEDGSKRISLIQDPPMTAVGHEELMARTALALRELDGQPVRARGELQVAMLWEARVEKVE
jgi:hypothetical protein